MGYFKNELIRKVNENLSVISDYCDNEAETWITDKVQDAYVKLYEASQLFEEIKATFDAFVEDNSEGVDSNLLWERCIEADEEFEELWDILERCI